MIYSLIYKPLFIFDSIFYIYLIMGVIVYISTCVFILQLKLLSDPGH